MNILHIEDGAAVGERLHKELRGMGYDVEHAFNLQTAMKTWNAAQVLGRNYDCLILDLDVAPPPENEWTSPRIKNSSPSYFVGFVWLIEWLLPKYPEMRKRTIIYSAYIDDLLANVSVTQDDLHHIRLVPKRAGSANKVMHHIDQISNMGPYSAPK